MRVIGIQNKIVVFFVSLLLMTQFVTFLMVSATSWTFIQQKVENQLVVGLRIFERLINSRGSELSQNVQILADDFAFKTAIVTEDEATIVSVLRNHSARVHADMALLMDLDHKITANTLSAPLEDDLFPFPKLIAEADQLGKTSGIVSFAGNLYQVVIVPVRAPLPIGLVCMGFLMDDDLAKDLSSITALDVSFVQKKAQWEVIASTLPTEIQSRLADYTNEARFHRTGIHAIEHGYQEFRQTSMQLNHGSDAKIIGVLSSNMQDALNSMNQLRLQMAGLFLISLIGSLAGTLVLAKGITKPLRTLVQSTRKIAEGGHVEPLKLRHGGEIGELVNEFNIMQSAIEKRESEIKYRAFYDTLTGLPNRTLFLEKLQEAIHKADDEHQTVATLVMDLNRFKDINDTLGHQIGDELLQEVALRVSGAFDESHLVSRLGGDEFAILIYKATETNTLEAVKTLSHALAKPFATHDVNLEITGSIGICMYPDHAENANLMLQRADIAMYIAKEEKALYRYYNPDFDKHSVFRLSLMSELKAAIKNNEMVLHYQPKIDLKTLTISHVEALVRWIHPRHGLISPVDFIPLAEQTGHIRYLTRWAMKTAAKQCYEWQQANIPIKAAVNISTVDLLDAMLVEEMRSLLNTIPIEPHSIVLEVTESAIMSDPEHAISVLHQLHDMGIVLSIDDFGTGYSSMEQLKKMPVDEIKIDQSFISHILTDSVDEIIVKATIELGHNIGLKVVAEGVDDINTLTRLQTLECDIAQGHYISPPLSVTDFAKWLSESEYGFNKG